MTVPSEILPMQIEVLYFEDCPNHLPTVERIYAVLREEGYRADVREVLVPDVSTAERVKFLGSPTVRVDLTLWKERVTLRFKGEVAFVKMAPASVPKLLITDGRFNWSLRH